MFMSSVKSSKKRNIIIPHSSSFNKQEVISPKFSKIISDRFLILSQDLFVSIKFEELQMENFDFNVIKFFNLTIQILSSADYLKFEVIEGDDSHYENVRQIFYHKNIDLT